LTGARPSNGVTSVIRQAARSGEPDRYLAATLAPPVVRDDLVALAAFLAEIGRIAHEVSDPKLGEIRIEWWREALQSSRDGILSGNPIADAFGAVVDRHGLSHHGIEGLLDAHVHGLYPAPPGDTAALQLETALREGTAFELAAKILGDDSGDGAAPVIEAAGIAYGLATLGLRLPYSLAKGRMPLPEAWAGADPAAMMGPMQNLVRESRAQLAYVKRSWGGMSAPLKAALLPLALVEPYLRVLEKPGHDPAHDVEDIAPLQRITKIAVAYFRGRL
jgi:15-cis-phytoene synthase